MQGSQPERIASQEAIALDEERQHTASSISPPPDATTNSTTADDCITLAQRRLNAARKGLLIFSALYTTFFAGAFFGYGPLQLLLEEDGAFSSKCDNDNTNGGEGQQDDSVCPEQTSNLLNVQLVAQLTLVLSPLLGHFCDKYGSYMLMTLLAVFGCTGIGLIMVASAVEADWLLYVAFPMIGIMSVSTNIVSVQTGFVFEQERSQRRVISALNALFDAGSITYLALWGIGESISDSIENSLLLLLGGYLALAIPCFGGAVFFWRRIAQLTTKAITAVDTSEIAMRDNSINSKTHNISSKAVDDVDPITNTDSRRLSHCLSSTESLKEDEVSTEDPPPSNTARDADEHYDVTDTEGNTDSHKDYICISLKRPMQQLKSGQFVTLVLFFAFHGARNNFTLATARDFLGYLGDNEEGNTYLSIFTLLMPASLIALPFVDQVLGRYGYHAGLCSINLLAIIHGTIQVSSKNLNVQVAGFVVFSFYRCFLFTVVFSFIPTFIGGSVLGRASGILIFFAGIFSFVNIPLAMVAVSAFDGNFFWPNLFYTVCTVPCMYAVWKIGKGIRREQGATATSELSAVLEASHHSSTIWTRSASFKMPVVNTSQRALGNDVGGSTSL